MSVKNFKFVSPGVFINEIDNSFIPKSADTIGPVVIGRSTRGLAMQPVRVQSYSGFVDNFGDTVSGLAGGDVYKDGNLQSPMYGTYAAKAFLRSNVAPLTYVRLLGMQHPDNDGTAGAQAGWQTDQNAGATGGGAFGLFVAVSSSLPTAPTASLAAVWYLDNGRMELSGTIFGGPDAGEATTTSSVGVAVVSDVNGVFSARVVEEAELSTAGKQINFSLDDTDRRYIRNVFNTNPQLLPSGSFYPETSEETYWLGETYDQENRDTLGGSLSGVPLVGFIANLNLSSSLGSTPARMKGVNTTEAKAGWFIAQDLKEPGEFQPANMQKLFRLKGRGHGAWLHENLKVSITNIRQSNTSTTDYGTFSVILRMLSDTDGAVQVVERFDNCSLDPASPNFISRKIGDQWLKWSETERRHRLVGDYANNSKFVYVDMESNVAAGATDPLFLPFGYYGPPKYSDGTVTLTDDAVGLAPASDEQYFYLGAAGAPLAYHVKTGDAYPSSAALTCSLRYPDIRLRHSSSDGGISKADDTCFGIDTTRTRISSRHDSSTKMVNRLLNNSIGDDPVGATITGIDSYSYIFTLDDIVMTGSSGAYYASGSRNDGESKTATSGWVSLLDAGYHSFTAPLWGGFDGVDITKPDPFYNAGMPASATEKNSYAYYTLLRAIDTVADPETVDMNLLVAPGVTNEGLVDKMVDVCESRGDVMSLIDLPDVYTPFHEAYKSDVSDRVGTTPQGAATSLRTRRIDSSYAATFYPWIQTREESNGQLLWIPPSVAMMGVLASSERKSQLWFAPAGFGRGGLSEGAAGIPVIGVSEKLTSKERDVLYDANINPIASFPSSGIVVFGQKTLQERQSALDRINVRRLVIYLKKQISIISTQILFEQNVPATWNRFKALVEPFLAHVKSNFGISDYKLILDESTTTPDLIDQNILYAKIMVKPARAIEYIAIDFVVASTGASFDD